MPNPSTVIPCPPWCCEQPGHGFDCEDPHGTTELREHARDVGSLHLDDAGDVLVGVVAVESRILDTDLVLVATPSIALIIDEKPYGPRPTLSSAQAREVAGWLIAAADQLDAQNGIGS